MLSYRLGTINDFHWEFKPVLSYSKPTLQTMNQLIVKYNDRYMSIRRQITNN